MREMAAAQPSSKSVSLILRSRLSMHPSPNCPTSSFGITAASTAAGSAAAAAAATVLMVTIDEYH